MNSRGPISKALIEEARTLPFIIMIFFALFHGGSGVDAIYKGYDDYILPKPWVEPLLEIKPREGHPRPFILYGARAKLPVAGRWVAFIEIDGERWLSNSGWGSYRPDSAPKVWSWHDFFNANLPEPQVPYRVCVFYDLKTRSGAHDITETTCSLEHTPQPEG